HEQVQGEDADVDVGGLDVVPDQRDGDRRGHPEPSGAVDPGGLVDFGGYSLDRGNEQQHVEADQSPHHDQHGDWESHVVAEEFPASQPGEALELVQAQAGQDAVDQTVGGVED